MVVPPILVTTNNVTTSSFTLGDAPNYKAWPSGGTRGDKPPSTLVDGVALGARLPSYPYPTSGGSPVTVSITATGNDGQVEKWGSAYGNYSGVPETDTAGTTALTRNDLTGFGGDNQFARGNVILRFDTSVIPDAATISAATLEIKSATTFNNVDSRSLSIEWIADPGTIEITDFSGTPSGTAKAATALSTLAASTAYSWALLSPDANISKTAYTGLRFHISDAAPTGTNRINFYTYDHTTEPEPKLIVTYA